MMLFSVGEIV